MDHQEALRLTAVEKYLLDEMSPEARDEFEEHYFGCQECAADLRATAAFLEAAKRELRADREALPVVRPVKRSLFAVLWRPVFVLPALAASLLVIVYQNVVLYPHIAGEVAQLRSAEVVPALSLVGGNARSAQTFSLTVPAGHDFILLLDIPTQDRFLSYTCSLYSPSGSLAWHVLVSAQQAKDTVSLRVPAIGAGAGSYTLRVQGNTGPGPDPSAVELTKYRFTLESRN